MRRELRLSEQQAGNKLIGPAVVAQQVGLVLDWVVLAVGTALVVQGAAEAFVLPAVGRVVAAVGVVVEPVVAVPIPYRISDIYFPQPGFYN
ncbi:MAG: hypothetical protein V3U20_03215 [Thermoplasmata archaeon]